MSIGQQTTEPVSEVFSLPTVSTRGNPAWEVATLYPLQGAWTEDDFFRLDDRAGCPMELVDGCLRLLPMPIEDHQAIVEYLFEVFKAFVVAHGLGRVRFGPLPIRFSATEIREPDLLFLSKSRPRGPKGYPEGAELVLEVVSAGPGDRKRDFEEKRDLYAAVGVPEYWIVDPLEQSIHVLVLDGNTYREYGVFRPGERAGSLVLAGLEVSVSEVFAAAMLDQPESPGRENKSAS